MQTIITTAISTVTSLIIGFLVARLKEYKKKIKTTESNNKLQNEALKLLLQNNLTNQYFLYAVNKEMYDYQYKNWLNMLSIYEELGGDDYIHTLAEKIKKFKIIQTDIIH